MEKYFIACFRVEIARWLVRQEHAGRHLLSTSSLLDDAEVHRSHWVLGTGDFTLSFGGFSLGGIGTATFGAILLNAVLNYGKK